MSIETPHSHVGFKVKYDELVELDTIVMRQSTWLKLQTQAAERIAHLREHEPNTPIHESTTISATHIGPLSGPDAGTGPVVPVGSLDTPAVLVPNMDDSRPNKLTIGMTPDNTEHLVAATPMPEPYPTDPTPPEPTDNVEEGHVTTHDVAPLPEHPELENQPPVFDHKEYADGSTANGPGPLPELSPDEQAKEEHDKEEWLRKEKEAKEHAQ